jgi:hypothetical protein
MVPVEMTAAVVGATRAVEIRESGTTGRRIPVRVPAWASTLVLDVAVSPGAWPRFTDFALSVWDSAGRMVSQQPLNYAAGRHEVAVDSLGGALVEVELFPAFALVRDTTTWVATVGLSFVAAASLGPESAGSLTAGPGEGASLAVPPFPAGVALPDGFAPLVEATARPDEGAPATRRGRVPARPHAPAGTR